MSVLTILTMLALAVPALADEERVWTRRYDPSSGTDKWEQLAKGPGGNVYVLGTSGGCLSQRLVIAKYSPGGRRLWVRTFTGKTLGGTTGEALAVDGKGNAFVTGHETYSGTGGRHIFLFKLANRTGKRIWLKRFDGPATAGNDLAYDLALGPKGAIYVCGTTTAVAGGLDALLLKYIDKGRRATRVWKRTYSNPAAPPLLDEDVARSVVRDSKGRIYFGGYSHDGVSRANAFIRRVTTKGKTVWTKRFEHMGSGGDEILDDLAAGGGFVAGGGYQTPAPPPDFASDYDAFVVRIAADGSNARYDIVDTVLGYSMVNDVAVDASGDIVAAGRHEIGTTSVYAAWLTKWDRGLTWEWTRTYESPAVGQSAIFDSVATGAGGSIYCGGQSNTGFITGFDFLLVKYSAGGVRQWADPYDDKLASHSDHCQAVLYVGGSRPAVYGAGRGGAGTGEEALLVKYRR